MQAEQRLHPLSILFRNERHVPYARIQNLHAVQNVFHRLWKVVEVRVETGGADEPEATMSVLPVSAYEEMRRRVFGERASLLKRSSRPLRIKPFSICLAGADARRLHPEPRLRGPRRGVRLPLGGGSAGCAHGPDVRRGALGAQPDQGRHGGVARPRRIPPRAVSPALLSLSRR